MSLNKGKAKAKPAMKAGGSNSKKPAVMDRREYDVAISGKTMAPGMYKKGGSTKKKFAALAPPYGKVTFADKIAGAKKGSKKK